MELRKHTAIIVSILLIIATFLGCTVAPPAPTATTGTTTTTNEQPSAAQPVQIYIYQNKVEIDEGLKASCAAYTALYPNVTFKVESNSNDYAATLKAMFAGGNAPDIFSTQGNEDLALVKDYAEDLSNESWVVNMNGPAKASGTIDGKVIGWPLAVEGYGYLYHKDLFAEAGITKLPATVDELASVCQQLKDHGIEPMLTNYAEWYQPGVYYTNMAIARQSDPHAFMQGLTNGTTQIIGNQEFQDMTKWINVEMEYSLSPLNMDFNTQMARFCVKDAAITLGGNFSQPTLDEVDPNMDVGMFPIPMGSDAVANDKMYVGANTFWSVNSSSESKEEAKNFLTWLCSDPEGEKYLTSDLKVLPGFTNVEPDESAIGPTGMAIMEYVNAGKTYGYLNSYYPNGMGGAQVFGESINRYAAGKITADELLQELQDDWQNAGK